MILTFIIVFIFFIVFRAIGTANDKSPLDRMGEMLSWKPMEKKKKDEEYIIKLEHKPTSAMFTIYSKKHPILREAWNRCKTQQEKAIICEACRIVYRKKLEKAIEEWTLSDEDKEFISSQPRK